MPTRIVQQAAMPVYPPSVVVEQGRPHHDWQGYEPAAVPVARGEVSVCNSETVGKALGGIAGAVIGSRLGNGTGRAVATIGRAVAGVLVGGEVGRRMDAGYQACVGQTLELAATGQRVQWQADGTQYAVVSGSAVQRIGPTAGPTTRW